MAEIAVTAIVTVLCEKLISGELSMLARSKGIDSQLNKWKETLPLIQAVLADASQKHITDRAVQLWVNNLQDMAYDIDDVLDDLATEAMRRKLSQEVHTSTSTDKVFKFFGCCTRFTPRNIIYGHQMSCKLNKITSKLNDLDDRRNKLGLNFNAERLKIGERRQEENSLVDESKIMGREGDREVLLGKLLGNEECDENVSIVSIVGMGGIGKTTLAKVLYNQERVKDHFEVRAWVCVSEELDVFHISQTIFQAVTGKPEDFANLDLLHNALKEKLTKKRFLLVLDDVWNEDYKKWELLQSPLLVGAPGSRVIVTTRSTRVASVMDSQEAYLLDVLSKEDALSLFAQYAVSEKNFDKFPTLKLLGEGIIEKCGRLPLALKTLGRVLKGNRSGGEWEELLKSEIWDIEDGTEILPALRLSYHHLPPHLKQLFAYCSLFPKDYAFDKNKLVLLWMAEGFLSQSKGNKSIERLGHRYFEELKSRSFFQHATNDEQGGYTMHDLINDLARNVAGEFFYRLDGETDASNMNKTFDKFRHFSLVCTHNKSHRKLKGLQRLRTLLLTTCNWESDCTLDKVLVELLPKLQLVRAISVANLNLDHYSIFSIEKVPQSIGSLKHLRYLNFSFTGIRCLPEEVSDLYNLQSLLVNGCKELSSLPGSFVKLTYLRHLGISNTPKLNKLPLGIGGLTSLQTLPKVMIEEGSGFKLSDLKGLSDLQDQLSIMGLNKVIDPMEAKDANLHQKKGLDVLEMVWSADVFNDSRNEIFEYEVLKELRPHPNLKFLTILFCKGTRFPNWVGDPSFDQLTELTFHGCRSTHLPTLGHLQSLKKLFVRRMDEVKTVGFELLAPTNSSFGVAFPSLEVLRFHDMLGWQRWSNNIGGDRGTPRSFPCLREISIASCPELAQVSVGLIPTLRVLHFARCSKAVIRSMVGMSSSLVVLKLFSIKGLTQLHTKDLMHLGALEDLYISACDDLRYLWEQESEACKSLVSLQKLTVRNCRSLVSFAKIEAKNGNSMESLKQVRIHTCPNLKSYNCPNSVEKLDISGCGSMTSLVLSSVQEHPSSLTESIISDSDNLQPIPAQGFGSLQMSRLTSLEIRDCKNLKSISHEHFESLTSLEEMWLSDCPSIDYSFPCGLWPPNLTTLRIRGSSKPMSEWGQQNFPTSLVELGLYGKNSGVVSFAVAEEENTTTSTPSSCFLLPPSLVSLEVYDFTDVESFSEVLQHLPCLKNLAIWSCPKIRDVKPNSGSSNLTIRVWNE